MHKNHRAVVVRLALALLVCFLGIALLADQVVGITTQQDASVPLLLSQHGPAATEQACYTLDTSRPEWLAAGPSTAIYLPVVLKNW